MVIRDRLRDGRGSAHIAGARPLCARPPCAVANPETRAGRRRRRGGSRPGRNARPGPAFHPSPDSEPEWLRRHPTHASFHLYTPWISAGFHLAVACHKPFTAGDYPAGSDQPCRPEYPHNHEGHQASHQGCAAVAEDGVGHAEPGQGCAPRNSCC